MAVAVPPLSVLALAATCAFAEHALAGAALPDSPFGDAATRAAVAHRPRIALLATAFPWPSLLISCSGLLGSGGERAPRAWLPAKGFRSRCGLGLLTRFVS